MHCSDYLEPGKPFVSVGTAFDAYTVSSLLFASFLTRKNTWLPRVLGGGSHIYICVSGFVSPEALESLRGLVEDGKLMVVVDSCWEMTDVLKVSFAAELCTVRNALEEIILTTKGIRDNAQQAKSGENNRQDKA